jgi:nucleoside-diphosphate kinase
MIKPDGVERRLVGNILQRFENRGFRMVALKMLNVSRELAESHYADHKGKSFYDGLLTFILSGPVVAVVMEADNAVALARRMMGTLDPLEAMSGTIRGDLTTDTRCNLIHGSDSTDAAAREIGLWFPELK